MNNILNITDNIIHFAFGIICHQDNEILITVNNYLIPLCPRCIGLHTGFFITNLLLFNHVIILKNNFQFYIIISGILIVGLHWLTGFTGILTQDHYSRFLTGLLSGSSFCILIKSFIYNGRKLIGNFTLTWALFCLVMYLFTNNFYSLKLTLFSIVVINFLIIIRTLWILVAGILNRKLLKQQKEILS